MKVRLLHTLKLIPPHPVRTGLFLLVLDNRSIRLKYSGFLQTHLQLRLFFFCENFGMKKK